jgi:hypothetical protein
MQIKLTNQEKEQFFFNAMCNGLSSVNYWGFEIDYRGSEYKLAKESLNNKGQNSVCIEDVFMQMLKMGFSIMFIDIECDGEYTTALTLNMVYNNIEKTPVNNLLNIHNEQDDASDADAVLQSVLFEEVIFG